MIPILKVISEDLAKSHNASGVPTQYLQSGGVILAIPVIRPNTLPGKDLTKLQ